MTRAVAIALLSLALIGARGAPLLAQRRVTLDVAPPTAMAGSPTVTTANLFGDPDMRDLVRSGFPASLRFRLELWRVGGLFNDLEGQREWELIVQYDPSAQRYRVVQRQGGRLDDLGSFATLSTAQAVLERPTRILLTVRAHRRRGTVSAAIACTFYSRCRLTGTACADRKSHV